MPTDLQAVTSPEGATVNSPGRQPWDNEAIASVEPRRGDTTAAATIAAAAAALDSPAPFDILGPTGTVNDPTPEITWQASGGAIGYDVVISTAPDLSVPVVEFFDVTGTSVTPAEPLDDGTYYVGVTAVGPNQTPQVDAGPDVTIGQGEWLVGAGLFTDPEHRVEATNNGLGFEVAPAAYHRIFATSAIYTIDTNQSYPPSLPSFGGTMAADWQATYRAFRGGLIPGWDGESIVYKALISSPTENARDRVTIEGEVRNRADEVVASSAAELWSGSLQAAVGYDAYGNAIPGGNRVWTGSYATGVWSGLSCGDWNLQSGGGLSGDATDQASAWMQIDTIDCAGSARLYAISPLLGVAPTVDAGGDAAVIQGEAFTRSGSFEDRGDVYWTATVDYGDGAAPQTLPLDFDAHSFQLDHTYTTAGPHPVTVTINDSDPSTDAAVATFEVEVSALGAVAANVGWVEERDPRGEDVGGEDIGGDLMRGSRSSTHPTKTQTWTATVDYDYGAGPVPLTLNPDKTFALNHQYTDPGTYTVTVSVTDDEGAEGIDTLQVTVPRSPEPFDILGPTGTVDDPTPEITWKASAGATGYDVVISTEMDLSTPVVEFFDVTETSVTPADPLDDGTYYVGVTAVGPNQTPQVDAGPDVTIAEGQWLVGAGLFTDPDHRVEATNNGFSFEISYVPPKTHTIFITESQTFIDTTEAYPPDFPLWGGLQAADYTCTYSAFFSGLLTNWDFITPIYKAILSTPTIDARDRIAIEGAVRNINGEIVAIDAAQLWSANLSNGVKYDEFGQLVPNGTNIWTGTEFDGTFANQSCDEWNQGSGSADVSSSPSATGSGWMFSNAINCSEGARLYAISPLLGVAPTVDVGGNAAAVQGEAFTRSGSFEDRGDVYWAATGAGRSRCRWTSMPTRSGSTTPTRPPAPTPSR